MSKALPGENYCLTHQGNHSHYDPINCTVCKMEKRIEELENAIIDLHEQIDVMADDS
jgi:hypothetical protein